MRDTVWGLHLKLFRIFFFQAVSRRGRLSPSVGAGRVSDTFFGGSLHFGPFPSLQPNSPGRASARHGLGPSFWIHFRGLGGFWLPSASWGASGEAPGRSWMPKFAQLGPQNRPKLGPKSHKNRSWRILAPDRVWEIVRGDSGTILEPKMAPT